MKKVLYIFGILLIVGTILSIFWVQELKYLLPTPLPEKHIEIKFGEKVDLGVLPNQDMSKPMFLHFFQKTCPCSRFNVKEFKRIEEKFKDSVNFIVVLQSLDSNAASKFKNKYDVEIPILHDPKGIISDNFGVYSTPQAVILKNDTTVYYRGNYNKARYCTKKTSAFANIALDELLKGKPLPEFNEFATTAYGCALPSDSTTELTITDIIFQN